MNIVDKATATQLKNIEVKTGKSFAELRSLILASGLDKIGAIRDMLKADFSLGHGDANTLAILALKPQEPAASGANPEEEIYKGPKAGLRPIHDAIMAGIHKFGEFEIAPKKTYLSLRRKKQFAMVGPATNTRIEVGLNMKDIPATDRLLAEKPGGMCQYKVKITEAKEVDQELFAWIRKAYDASA
jgi:hypothetical protein